MPVVINEFEVVTEPPRPPSGGQGQPSKPPPAPTPKEIVRSIRRQEARQARVRAH